MLNVCKNCFSDREIEAFITSHALHGNCDFCGTKSIEIVPIEELYDFFKELLDNFKRTTSGTPLKSKLQGSWSLFSSLSSAYAILNFVISKISTTISNADDLVDFNDDILDNVNFWEKLKNQLVWENRYLTDVNYLTDELGWDGFFNSKVELVKGINLYRARLHYASPEPPYSSANMFCPHREIATAGRANPAGIPFLYLSDNSDTVLYEIRASYLDEVSIGTFTVKSSLTAPVIISDFTESETIFHPSRVAQKIKITLLKQKISADLSKPMRRYDSELEYIPTQFICEFIKIYTGVQGIKFRSSLHTLGNNIVIFDQNLMDCINVTQVKVNRVLISP
jgi:hypothetical protein